MPEGESNPAGVAGDNCPGSPWPSLTLRAPAVLLTNPFLHRAPRCAKEAEMSPRFVRSVLMTTTVRRNPGHRRAGPGRPAAPLPPVRHRRGEVPAMGHRHGPVDGPRGLRRRPARSRHRGAARAGDTGDCPHGDAAACGDLRQPRSQVRAALFGWAADRAQAAGRAGKPDALALLDAAYVTEAFRQIGMLGRRRGSATATHCPGGRWRD